MKRRVVITGMGQVSAMGHNVPDAIAAAIAGKSGIRRCDERLWGEYGEKIPCRVGGTVVDFDPGDTIPKKFLDRYDPAVVYALTAAREAIADSGIEFTDEQRDRTAVLIGTAVTGNDSWHKTLRMAFADKKAEEIPGYLVMQISGNMPSGLVALEHKFRGPNVALVNACATGGASISVGSDFIRYGRADVVLAGGTEAAIGIAMYATFVNAQAVNPTDDPVRASKPFCADRNGFIKGEGSGVLVLEPLEHAQARGARIYGEVLGDSLTNDAYHIVSPNPTGDSWARAMRLALENAEITPNDVDYISAHAASTRAGDPAETKAIKKLFGERAYDIPITSSKSLHGHIFGGTGAVELILALGAMRQDKLVPTINLTMPDPEMDLDYVPNQTREKKTEILLKNSFGFGGTNSCVVVKKW